MWVSLLTGWAVELTGWLNRILPRDEYRTYPDVSSGFRVGTQLRDRGGPPPAASVPGVLLDICEVHVFEPTAHLRPVGVLTFVRPTPKSQLTQRLGLVWSCLSYLHRGIPLALVDVVDVGEESVHDDIAAFLGAPPLEARITVAGYRPVRRDDRDEADVWAYPIAVGQPIPAVPLGLRDGPTVVLDLEGTYTGAIRSTGP